MPCNYWVIYYCIIKQNSCNLFGMALQILHQFQIDYYTWEQCSNKWENLIRTHKKLIGSGNITGAAAMPKPAFCEEMHAIIKESHAGTPVLKRSRKGTLHRFKETHS